MSDYDRTIPAAGLAYDKDWWKDNLDLSKKVAVFWPISSEEIDLIGYYDSVSDANAAALAEKHVNGATPFVRINWFHDTIIHIEVGPISHPNAAVELPGWLDEEPQY